MSSPNPFRIASDHAVIVVNGAEVLIDTEDLDRVLAHRWSVDKLPGGEQYIRCRTKGLSTPLHRFIMSAPKGVLVEHVNGNHLDNRKENLRVVTYAEKRQATVNNQQGDSASGVKNVSITREPDGRQYYFAAVKRDGIAKRKSFPFTPDGLEAARQLVEKWREDISYEPERTTKHRPHRDFSYQHQVVEKEVRVVRVAPEELPVKTWRIDGNDAYLTIRPGIETIVSTIDMKRVAERPWWLIPNSMGQYYAATKIDRRTVYLHQFIAGVNGRDYEVDHENHDTLDNRRENLRVMSREHNDANRDGAYQTSKTGVRGVSIHKVSETARMYVFRCHVQQCKIAKYFPFSPEGLEEAKQFAEAHHAELRERLKIANQF